MRAWTLRSTGEPAQVLHLDDVDVPTPGENEMLVDVEVAGAIEAFPTAAVAVLSVAGPWSALQPGCASLESFWASRQSR